MVNAKSEIPIAHRVFIVDTCSVISVRRDHAKSMHGTTYKKLTARVQFGDLIFPVQVFGELDSYAPDDPDKRAQDLPLQWVTRNREIGTRRCPDFKTVAYALSVTPKVLDVEKPKAVDEADPYMLALALELQSEGHEVTILTEDRRDTPKKMSLVTACGLHRLISLPMLAFLEAQKLI